ncbi:hypothetical protein K438DRAFT_126846 [Mycena galopus ATCC 62051]|nr:hypothetical protein K438DRAFT_126846 [Mycena galopus ATCC 62051]
MFAPHLFCVDDDPRPTVSTRIACPRCDPTSRASCPVLFFGVFHNATPEGVPTAIHAVFSHTGVLSSHGVAPATRLSLGTCSHTISALLLHIIVGARTLHPILTSRKAPARTPTILRSATVRSLPHISCVAHRPSSTPSTPTTLERSKRHAPRLVAPLPVGKIYSACTAPRLGSRYTGAIACATLYDIHTLDTVPSRTLASPRTTSRTRSTRRCRSSPPRPPSRLPRTATPFSSVPPSPLEVCTCRAPRHHHHILRLQCTPWPFPITSAAFIAKRVSSKQDSPYPRACFRAFPTRHRLLVPPTCSAYGATIPHRPHRVDRLPARHHRIQRLTTLRSKPAPVRHPKHSVGHHRSAQQVRRAFPTPFAAFIASPRAAPTLCADAGLRSKSRPLAAHRECDVANRTTMPLDSRPGFERVAPRVNGIGLVRSGRVCDDGGNGRDGWCAPAVRRFAYRLRDKYTPASIHIF